MADRELTDDEAFGAPQQGELSDEQAFGAPPAASPAGPASVGFWGQLGRDVRRGFAQGQANLGGGVRLGAADRTARAWDASEADVQPGDAPPSDPRLAPGGMFSRPPQTAPQARAGIAQQQQIGVERIIEQQPTIEANPPSAALQEVAGAGSFGDAAMAALRNPAVIPQVTAQSLPQMLPGLVAGALGGPGLGAMVMGGSSAASEYGGAIVEAIDEQLASRGLPATQENRLAAARDPELMAAARSRGTTRGAIIGTADAVSGGAASRVLLPSRTLASRPVAREVVNTFAAQPAAQMVAGAGGEAAAQLATNEWKPGEIFLEALGELGGAPGEALAMGRQRIGAQLSSWAASRRTDPAGVTTGALGEAAAGGDTDALAILKAAGMTDAQIAALSPGRAEQLAGRVDQRRTEEAGRVVQPVPPGAPVDPEAATAEALRRAGSARELSPSQEEAERTRREGFAAADRRAEDQQGERERERRAEIEARIEAQIASEERAAQAAGRGYDADRTRQQLWAAERLPVPGRPPERIIVGQSGTATPFQDDGALDAETRGINEGVRGRALPQGRGALVPVPGTERERGPMRQQLPETSAPVDPGVVARGQADMRRGQGDTGGNVAPPDPSSFNDRADYELALREFMQTAMRAFDNPGRFTAPEGRLPQTPSNVQSQREAGEAFTSADAQRGRAGADVRDTQAAGRPEGPNPQPVMMHQGFPVRIVRTSSDGKTVEVERYDPRTGKAEDGATRFAVKREELQTRNYSVEPRRAQDVVDRSRGPRTPEQPRMADEPGVRREPNQTYRTTEADPNSQFPGATSGQDRGGPAQGRSPFPGQDDSRAQNRGPFRRWSTAEEYQRAFNESRRRSEKEAEQARARSDWYGNTRATNEPQPLQNGRFPIDENGYVLSTGGGPLVFGDQKQAARWIISVGNKQSRDQIFEIAVHPSMKGRFAVKQRGIQEDAGPGPQQQGPQADSQADDAPGAQDDGRDMQGPSWLPGRRPPEQFGPRDPGVRVKSDKPFGPPDRGARIKGDEQFGPPDRGARDKGGEPFGPAAPMPTIGAMQAAEQRYRENIRTLETGLRNNFDFRTGDTATPAARRELEQMLAAEKERLRKAEAYNNSTSSELPDDPYLARPDRTPRQPDEEPAADTAPEPEPETLADDRPEAGEPGPGPGMEYPRAPIPTDPTDRPASEDALLIIRCGSDKSDAPGTLPAIERYTGPMFRDLAQIPEGKRPTVLILSGKYGLLSGSTPIPAYDQQMGGDQADALANDEESQRRFADYMERGAFKRVFVVASGGYRAALDGLMEAAPDFVRNVSFAKGDILAQRAEYTDFLRENGGLPAKDRSAGKPAAPAAAPTGGPQRDPNADVDAYLARLKRIERLESAVKNAANKAQRVEAQRMLEEEVNSLADDTKADADRVSEARFRRQEEQRKDDERKAESDGRMQIGREAEEAANASPYQNSSKQGRTIDGTNRRWSFITGFEAARGRYERFNNVEAALDAKSGAWETMGEEQAFRDGWAIAKGEEPPYYGDTSKGAERTYSLAELQAQLAERDAKAKERDAKPTAKPGAAKPDQAGKDQLAKLEKQRKAVQAKIGSGTSRASAQAEVKLAEVNRQIEAVEKRIREQAAARPFTVGEKLPDGRTVDIISDTRKLAWAGTEVISFDEVARLKAGTAKPAEAKAGPAPEPAPEPAAPKREPETLRNGKTVFTGTKSEQAQQSKDWNLKRLRDLADANPGMAEAAEKHAREAMPGARSLGEKETRPQENRQAVSAFKKGVKDAAQGFVGEAALDPQLPGMKGPQAAKLREAYQAGIAWAQKNPLDAEHANGVGRSSAQWTEADLRHGRKKMGEAAAEHADEAFPPQIEQVDALSFPQWDLSRAFVAGAQDASKQAAPGKKVQPVLKMPQGVKATDRFGTEFKEASLATQAAILKRAGINGNDRANDAKQVDAIVQAYVEGARWGQANPDDTKGIDFTLETARGRKTNFKMPDAAAARSVADNLEKLPANVFYANPLSDPEAWNRFLIRPLKTWLGGTIQSVKNAGWVAAKGFHIVFSSSDGQERARAARYDGEARSLYTEILDLLHPTAGKPGPLETFAGSMSRSLARGAVAQRIKEAWEADGFTDSQVREAVLTPRKATDGKLTAHARKVQAFFREELDYAKESTVEVSDWGRTYMPRVFDRLAVLSAPSAFVKAAAAEYRKTGMARDDAQKAAEELLLDITAEGVGMLDRRGTAGSGGGSSFTSERSFGPGAEDVGRLGKFYVTDLGRLMGEYAHRVTKRSEIAVRFGDRFSKWGEQREQLLAAGVTPADVQSLEAHVAVATGTMAQGRHAPIRHLSDWARTMTTLSTMEQATVINLSELLMGGVRTGNLGDTLTGAMRSLRQTWRETRGAPRDVHAEFAEDIGVIGGHMTQAIMAARFSAGDISGQKQADILAKFFRGTLLEQLTTGTRVGIMQTGTVFFHRLATDLLGTSAYSKWKSSGNQSRFYLQELGVPASMVDEFAHFVAKLDGRMPTEAQRKTDMGQLYVAGLRRFTDQGVQRPDPAMKPRWANHPIGAAVFMLQAYVYAFTKNVLYRGMRLAKEGATGQGYTPLERIAFLAPLMLALPLFAAGQWALNELRGSWTKDRDADRRKTTTAKVEDGLLTSGLLGAAGNWAQLGRAPLYNRDIVSSAAGPVFGQGIAFLNDMTRLFFDNSPRTNTAERRATRTAYRTVAEPAAQLILNMVPTPGLLAIPGAAARMAVGSRPVQDRVTDAIAGREGTAERRRRRGQRIEGVSERLVNGGERSR